MQCYMPMSISAKESAHTKDMSSLWALWYGKCPRSFKSNIKACQFTINGAFSPSVLLFLIHNLDLMGIPNTNLDKDSSDVHV